MGLVMGTFVNKYRIVLFTRPLLITWFFNPKLVIVSHFRCALDANETLKLGN